MGEPFSASFWSQVESKGATIALMSAIQSSID